MNENVDGYLTKIIGDYSPTDTLNNDWDFYHSVIGWIDGKYFSVDFTHLKGYGNAEVKINRSVSHGCVGRLRKIIKNYKDLID